MLNRRVGKALMLLAALMCLLLVPPTARADSKARIVRLSYVDGNAQIDRGEGQGFEKAIMNMPVIQGAKISTSDAGAKAEVELEDGSAVRLTPETRIAFPELGLRDSGQRITSVDVLKGTAYFNVRKHAGDFRVTAGGQQLEIPDNTEFRVSATNQRIELAVYKGEVKVPSASKEIKVKKNETLALDVADLSQETVAKGISSDPYDDWNHERDQYRDMYASTSYSSGSGFSSAYSYGYADLNYYGNYFYAPGWGLMWQPFGIGPGWSPFMDGAWMWYPGPGYMWVSSYPWGWMPYRYGAWNFVPGFGWAWFPGRTWNNWVAYTPVRTAPAGYVAPIPPSAIGGARRTAFVGSGGTTIYPANLGRPGSVPLNQTIVHPNARGGVTLIRPTTVGRATSTTTHAGGARTGATVAAPHGATAPHTSTPASHMSGAPMGGMHTSGGMGGTHSSGSSGHTGGRR